MRAKLVIFFVFITHLVLGEGTKELGNYYVGNTIGGLILATSTDGTYTNFGLYDAPSDYQIKIRVADTTETIYLGMQIRNNGKNLINNMPFRVLDPSGNVVFTSLSPGTGQQGFISSFNQGGIGPNINGITTGYDPFIINPDTIGDYVIEFNPKFATTQEIINIPYFDVTVADSSGKINLGRLHSKSWQMSSGSYTVNPVMATVYPYHPNGVVYSVNFNGIRPFVFSIFFNSTGTGKTGIIKQDRQSVIGYSKIPEYEVFLNPPDSLLYPINNQNIEYTASITKSDCETSVFCIEFDSENRGVVDGFIDFNGNSIYEQALGDILFIDIIDSTGSTCVEWDGLDGNGNPISSKDIQIISKFGSGTMHLPLYDIEHNPNGYIIKTYAPTALPDPLIFWDDVRITAGTTQGTPKVNLTGCKSTSTQGCHKWIDRGGLDGNRAGQETINTWWYSDILYDTLSFTYIPNEPVRLSYEADSLIKDHPKVCVGDTVDFFVYNNKANHWDTTSYNYYWFANNDLTDTLLLDLNNLKYAAEQETMVHLYAEFKRNKDCISFDSILIGTVEPIKAALIIEPMPCTSTTTEASVQILSDGGQESPVITWKQFPGSNDSLQTGLVPKQLYEFVIQDNNYSARCAFDSSFTVIGSRFLEIESISGDSSLCYETTGDVSVTMVNKAISYSYSWNGAAFQSFNALQNLKSGDYTVVIRDDSTLCIVDTIIPVTPIPFEITKKSTPDLCSQGKGTAEIEIPSPVLTVEWEDASLALKRTNLVAGDYSVRVYSTLDSTCEFLDSVTIENTNIPFEVDLTIAEATVCYDSTGTAEIIMKDYPAANFEYSWNGGPLEKITKKEKLLSNTYTVFVQDLVSGCFTDTSIFVPEIPFEILAEVKPELCHDAEGEIKLAIPSTKLSVLWDNTSTLATRSNLSAGTYSVTVFSNLSASCSADSSFEILDSALAFKVDTTFSEPTLCYDSTGAAEIVMKAFPNAEFEYSWNGAAFDVVTRKEQLLAKTYFISIRDKNSLCVLETNIIVAELPFVIDGIVKDEKCLNANGSIEIDIPSDKVSILWDDNSTLTTRENLSAGTYSVNVFSNLSVNCTVDTSFEVVNEDIVFEVDSTFSRPSLCYDSTGKAGVVMKNYPEADFEYSWDGGIFEAITTKENLLSKNYAIQIIDKNSKCATSTSVFVPILPFTIAATSGPEKCTDSTGFIEITIPSNKLMLTWEDGFIDTDLRRDNLTNGTYTFTISSDLQDVAFCKVDTSITIEDIINKVTIKDVAIVNPNCLNPLGGGEIIVEPLTAQTNYEIQWQDLGTGLSTQFSRNDLAQGTYQARVFEKGTKCFADTTFSLETKGFDFDMKATETICKSKSGKIDVEVYDTLNKGFSIEWEDINQQDLNRTKLADGQYKFALISDEDPSCRIDTFINVTLSTYSLTASFDVNYHRALNDIFLNDTIKFINTSPVKTPIVVWDMSDGTVGKGDIFKHTYKEMGDYTAKLYIEDEFGCFGEASTPLRVLNYKDCGIAMPNAFTPNKDGINDDIGILGFADEIELRIYNRWGEIVYRSFEIKERWDGTFLKGESPTGTYIYQLDYKCVPINGVPIDEFVMGEITLIR